MTQLTIVMYHYVRPIKNSRYPLIKGLELELFKGQLDHLQKHYTFISIEEIISAYHEKKPLPKNSVFLTFDDGYLDHYLYVFPELMYRGIKGAFFPPAEAIKSGKVLDVNKIHYILASQATTEELLVDLEVEIDHYRTSEVLPSFSQYRESYMHADEWDSKEIVYIKRMLQHALPFNLRNKIINKLFKRFVCHDEIRFSSELYMNVQQLQLMAQCGMHVGSHGVTHSWLEKLSDEEQTKEIKASLDFLLEIDPKRKLSSICYPYGSYNKNTLDICKSHDISLGFTTRYNIADLSKDDILTLPRLDTNHLPMDSNYL